MNDEQIDDRAAELRRKAQDLMAQADELDKLKEPSSEFGAVIKFIHNGYLNVAVRRAKGWVSTGHLSGSKSMTWSTMIERYPNLAEGDYQLMTNWTPDD